jgi:hypothetical protein
MSLPQWFLDMSFHQINAVKALLLSCVDKHGLDESYLDGERHRNMTDEVLNLCEIVSKIGTVGQKVPSNTIILEKVPFGWVEINKFCFNNGIDGWSGKKRGDLTMITFETEEDALRHFDKLNIGLWAETACIQ